MKPVLTHRLTWHGHSNFLLTTGEGIGVLIDPFFEGNPTAPFKASDLRHVDLVLITHDHGDHVGQAVEICKATGATAVGVYDTMQSLLPQGLDADKVVGMNIGGTVTRNGIRIKMVQAMHSSATGVAAGYILTLEDGFCLYHAGDTGLFASMELFGRFHSIDTALLPVGGWFTMDAPQAAYACKLLGCRKAVPMHWGTFPILEQNTSNFAAELDRHAPDTQLVSMAPGETISLRRHVPDQACECD